MIKFEPGWTQTDNQAFEKQVTEIIKKTLPLYLKSQAFTDRKLTDTPTDDLQVVNRKYVNLSGTTAQRPVSSVIGQQYFDTSVGYPIFKNSNYRWVNSVGSVV